MTLDARRRVRCASGRSASSPIPACRPAKRRQRWPVPLVVRRDGDRRCRRPVATCADRRVADVPVPPAAPAWCYGNAAAGGFYRVLHDAATRRGAPARARRLLGAVERMALVGDQWALVRAGRARRSRASSTSPTRSATRPTTTSLDGVAAALAVDRRPGGRAESAEQAALRAWIARRFGPALRGLGWAAAADEPDDVRLRRAALLRLVGGVAEAPEVLAEARRRLDAYLADRGALEPNLADAVVSLAARVGDARALRALSRGRCRRADAAGAAALPAGPRVLPDAGDGPPHARRAAERGDPDPGRRLRADAAVRQPRRSRRGVALPQPPLGARCASACRRSCWRASSTRRRRCARRGTRARCASSSATHPLPEAARALRQALERFRLNAELRRRTAPGVARWLAPRAE